MVLYYVLYFYLPPLVSILVNMSERDSEFPLKIIRYYSSFDNNDYKIHLNKVGPI